MRAAAIILAAIALAVVVAGPARAEFGIAAFDGELTADAAGTPSTQAGAHPFAISTTFRVNTTSDPQGRVVPDGALRDVRVDLPPGFVGNAASIPACPGIKELLGFACPNGSQVGVATLELNSGSPFQLSAPIYNMRPPSGVPARFGFQINATTQVVMDARIRTDSDYGLSVAIRNASQAIPMLGATVTFWGVPAAPVHDAQRCGLFVLGDTCIGPPNSFVGPNPAGVAPSPFLTNPGACGPVGEGLRTGLEAVSWHDPPQIARASFLSHRQPGFPLPPDQWGAAQGMTGCERLAFDPRLRVSTDSAAPDTPTGAEIEIAVPQDGLSSLGGLAPANVRGARVTLPERMTLSPPVADGLRACSDAAFGVTADRPPDCPRASKLGAVNVASPALDQPLVGSLFVGEQRSGDPESGELFRVLLYAASEARGVLLKLPGQVTANAATGRVTARFASSPQLPFARLAVRLKGGARAPFATPPGCGAGAFEGAFASWAGHERRVTAPWSVACAPPRAFAPGFEAGSAAPVAGAFSPVLVRFDRADGQPYLRGLSLRMPSGLLARPAGVELCGDGPAAAGACPAASRVGRVVVSAGAGPNPLRLAGSVYLTGPYKGAPYGLAVVVPVAAGPFDLGVVAVRLGVYVDPVDARVSIVSDPLPTIVDGVPIRLRRVVVDLDRPGLAVNPTSCARKAVRATLSGAGGQSAERASRFQVGGCDALRYRPRLRLRLTGRRRTAIGRHPGIAASLDTRAGHANVRRLRVVLPLALALDPANADELCAHGDGLAAGCPPESIVGRAVARTPLLERPLAGPVYLVQGTRRHRATGRTIRTLPTLLVTLRGEVAIDLRARTSVRRKRLVATFPAIPDAPVSDFDLELYGGRDGILVVTRRLCGRPWVAQVRMRAHNRKRRAARVRLATPCRDRGGRRAIGTILRR